MSGKTQRPGAAERRRALGHRRRRATRLPLTLVVIAVTFACLAPAGASARWRHVSAHHSRTQPYFACGPDHSGARCHLIVDPTRHLNRSGPVPAGAITAGPELEASPALSGHGVEGGYSPEDLRKAYGKPPEQLPSTTAGKGQKIAIVDARDDPNAEADLAVYRSHYGLPECTTANGCFKKVNQSGGTIMPAPNAEWAEEISLDLDMASAICPNCDIVLVEATTPSSESLAIAVREAVKLGATEISNSYGSPAGQEPPEIAAYDHPGIPITVAAGDEGFGVEVPADNPHVIAVGGTTLVPEAVTKAHPRGWNDTVWFGTETNEKGELEISGTGSGCSTEEKPTWQLEMGCTGRTNNDIAVVGDQNTPVSAYDSYHPSPKKEEVGPWMLEGGTSVGAPLVAAAMALSSSYTRSFDGAHALYIDSLLTKEAFNDVISGKDAEKCASYLCEAKVGYDGPSGLGTLNGTPEAPQPVLVTEAATAVGASEATLNASINPKDAGFTECRFEYVLNASEFGKAGTPFVTASCPPASPESGTTAKPVSAHVTGLKAATGYHFRITAFYQGQSSSGGESTFTTAGAKPTASTEAATAITTTAATLNAKVDPNGGLVSECRFQYGPTSEYGFEVPCKSLPGSGQSFVAVSASVGSLSPAKTYHFRIVAKNSFGEGEGSDGTFTTGAVLPEVAPQPASDITETTATLNATVNPLGLKVTACRFEYGRTTTYEAAVPCSAMPGEGHSPIAVAAEISELLPGRPYHFRIVASNAEGTSSSTDESFIAVAEPPVSVTEGALAVGSGSETLTGAVAPNGAAITACRFEYGTSAAGILEASVPCSSLPADPEEDAAVSASVSGLAPATTYHYRLVTSSSGGTSYGDTLTFTTAAAQLPGGGGLEEQPEGHGQPAPGLPTLASHKLSVNAHGTIAVPVKCPAGSSTCSGTISLQVVKAAGASSHQRHASKHHVLVALGTFKVVGGRVTTVRLRLSHTAKALLRRSHVLHASATITPAAGKAARTSVTIRSS